MLAQRTHYRYAVLTALCLAAALSYVARNSIGAAESSIREELALKKKDTRWIIIGFFATYALCQVPTGQIGHRWGSRRALPLFALLGAAATSWFALAGGLAGLLMSRLAMGTAQAGLFPCATNTMGHWFPAGQRAFASGLLASFMSIGGACGVALTGMLLGWFSWRVIFLAYSVPLALWAVWFHWMFRDHPSQHPRVNAEELALIQGETTLQTAGTGDSSGSPDADRAVVRTVSTPWLALLLSPPLWAICIQQFFRAAGYIFYASWFATFLQEARGVSIPSSGILTSLPLWATVVGAVCGGRLSDAIYARTGSRRLSRKWLAAASMALCALLIFVSYGVRDPQLAVLLISCGAFAAAVGGPCAYAITIDMGGDHVAPVFSLMNMTGNIGAVVFPFVVPEIVAATNSWNGVLFLFALLYVAAAAAWLFLNPQGTVLEHSLRAPIRPIE